MSKHIVTYVGDPNADENEKGKLIMRTFGCVFKFGQKTEVDVNDQILGKLRGNSHFLVDEQHDDIEAVKDEENEGREYTVAELTQLLADGKVRVPAKFANDAEALMDLVVKNNITLPE